MNGDDVANTATKAMGGQFHFQFEPISRHEATSILEGELDPSEVDLLLDLLDTQTRTPCNHWPTDTIADITGRNATSLATFFEENADSFKPKTNAKRSIMSSTKIQDTVPSSELLQQLLEAENLHVVAENNSLGVYVAPLFQSLLRLCA